MNARKFGGLMELCGHFSKQDSYAITVRQPLPDTPCRTHCIYIYVAAATSQVSPLPQDSGCTATGVSVCPDQGLGLTLRGGLACRHQRRHCCPSDRRLMNLLRGRRLSLFLDFALLW